MMRRICYLVLWSLLVVKGVSAQSGEAGTLQFPEESLKVVVNNQLLLTGEVLYFQVYSLNQRDRTLLDFSKAAYLELIDASGESVLQTAIALSKGQGFGQLFIPSSLNTGNYNLVAYTQWMRNDGPGTFTQKIISIINPFRTPNASGVSISNNPVEPPTSTLTSSGLVAQLDQPSYKTREMVNLSVNLGDQIGAEALLSINVRADNPDSFSPPVLGAPTTTKGLQEVQHLPELRGQMVTGVLTTDGVAAANQLVYLTEPNTDYQFYVCHTTADGRFHFVLNPTFGTMELVAQADPSGGEKPIVELDNQFEKNHEYFIPPKLQLNEGLKDYLEQRSIDLQVENAYYQYKQDSTPDGGPRARFYDRPDKAVDLDEFTRFTVMEEVMRELVSSVFIRRENGKQVFKVRNFDSQNLIFDQSPLMLIDGVPVFDAEEILQLDPLNFKQIEVIGRKYFLGPATLYGIASFSTYEGDYKGFTLDEGAVKFEFQGVQNPTIPYSPNYDGLSSTSNRIPDRRRQLYWNPEVTVDANEASVSFYTSDVTGTFELIITGIDGNGQLIDYRSSFEVITDEL